MNSKHDYNPTFSFKRRHEIIGHQSLTISQSETAPSRSLTEAAFGDFLIRYGQKRQFKNFGKLEFGDFEDEKTSVKVLDEYKTNRYEDYKPDYTLYYGEDANGNRIADIIDIKGKDYSADTDQQELSRIIPKGVLGTIQHDDDGKVDVTFRAFAIINPRSVRYYDQTHTDTEGIEARIFVCPECGRVEILPEHRLTCSTCGHEFGWDDEHVDPWDALRKWQDIETCTTDAAKAARDAFRESAIKHGLEFFDKQDASCGLIMRIQHEQGNGQMFCPDFAYISQDHRQKTFKPTPIMLSTGIFIFDNMRGENAAHIKSLVKHAAHHETAYDAIVIVTAEKEFYICERDKGEKLRKAKWCHCEACGNTYIASAEYPECPFCNGDGITA